MTTTEKKVMTTQEVAARFMELFRQEGREFEIQDELFAENVRSVDPPISPYFGIAEGKAAVRKKGEDIGKRIEAVHRLYTGEPIICGNHFAVAREVDLTFKELGRVLMAQIMLYEVKDGKIVLEQFFY